MSEIGRAWIDPTGEVVAGSFGTWRLVIEAGSQGVEVGGRIRVFTDSDTDWGIPQFLDPAAADYMRVESPATVRTSVQVTGPKSLVLTVYGEKLQSGEQITLLYGDRSAGGPGSRAQTFCEENRFFWISVDVDGGGKMVTLDDSPHVAIVGGDAVRLVVVACSTVTVGESFRLLIKAEDAWGNPSRHFQDVIELTADGIEIQQPQIQFTDEDGGALWLDGFAATRSGTLRIAVCAKSAGLNATSNPIIVADQPAEHQLCWADPHGGQVVSNAKIADFFRYARDVAGIQFVGYQRNADVITVDDWEVQQQQERAFYEPGRFVPIPGFEWSGRTWQGGHHNVYFRRHDQPVRRNTPAEAPGSVEKGSELSHIRDVYEAYRNSDLIITPHVGGEHSNLNYHEPTLEPAVEITSSHGSFEWMLYDALRRGYKLGFLGGSDSYTGRPGDDRPGHQSRRYSKAGLTGIYTKDVTLASFIDAMRARRVYATTGARMVLGVASDGHVLGAEYSTAECPTITVNVSGTAALESIELFRDRDCIYSHPIASRPVPNRVRILWKGSSRMTSYSGVVWDGTLEVDGGSIHAIETIRFDSPRSQITEQTSAGVAWQAWGCGYTMGLLLDLEGDAETELRLAVGSQTITGPMYGGHGDKGPPRRISFAPADRLFYRVRLGDLAQGGERLPIGVLDRELTVSLASESGPDSAQFDFTDESPRPGVNPYWVRVIQRDMEMGWTSPVFVDYVA